MAESDRNTAAVNPSYPWCTVKDLLLALRCVPDWWIVDLTPDGLALYDGTQYRGYIDPDRTVGIWIDGKQYHPCRDAPLDKEEARWLAK